MRSVRAVSLAFVILGVIALGVFGFTKMREASALASSAQKEAELQEPEIKACKERLAKFYAAFGKYKKEHEGQVPPSFEALIPKYITTDEMMCPTAARWHKDGYRLGMGQVRLNGKDYPATYGFMWLANGWHHAVKTQGDKAPLFTCQAHEDGLYRAAYKKSTPLGSFSSEGRATLDPAVNKARMLTVRANGQVDEIDPASEQ